MTDLKEHNVWIIFCFKLWKKCCENFQNIESCFWRVENGKNIVFACFHKFKSGMTSAKSGNDLGHPFISKPDENTNWGKEPVLENRRITICEAADKLGICLTSVQNIMKDVQNFLFFKKTNKSTWMYESNFITQKSPTCFGHLCGQPHGGETIWTHIRSQPYLCPAYSARKRIMLTSVRTLIRGFKETKIATCLLSFSKTQDGIKVNI